MTSLDDAIEVCPVVSQIAVSSMQGWRPSMEDTHVVFPTMPRDSDASFFGVYDGHGGVHAARYLRDNLHKELVASREYSERRYIEALRRTFIDFDKRMHTSRVLPSDLIGSTAVTLLLKNKTLYCANLGDSRAVASVRGHAVPLSYDHKPSNPKERKRIEANNFFVLEDRINGSLAIARCFGDFVLKKRGQVPAEHQAVSCYPDVAIKTLTEDMEFVVLACDGIWECKSSQEVVDFVRRQLAFQVPVEKIVENLMNECLAKDFSRPFGYDNMTVIIVCFVNSQTYVDFCRKCSSRKPVDIDPQALMITMETGPPDRNTSNRPVRLRQPPGSELVEPSEVHCAYTSFVEAPMRTGKHGRKMLGSDSKSRSESRALNGEKQQHEDKSTAVTPQASTVSASGAQKSKTAFSQLDFTAMKNVIRARSSERTEKPGSMPRWRRRDLPPPSRDLRKG